MPAAGKTQYFAHLSLNSPLRLINGISSDLQKWLKSFNDKAIVAFFGIAWVLFRLGWASEFTNSLGLYSRDLKLLLLEITTLKLVASYFEENYKIPVVSE